MKKLLILFILILPLLCPAANKYGKKTDEEKQKLLNQIQQLKQNYTKLQSDLQQVTEKRWSARQKQVSIKEDNKENSENLLQQVERFYSDVARAREEVARFLRDHRAVEVWSSDFFLQIAELLDVV